MNWLKYSGVWFGFILNPFHWRIRWERGGLLEWPVDHVFENCIYFGPVYIRVIIDDGRW